MGPETIDPTPRAHEEIIMATASATTYTGYIRDGVVILDEGTPPLPEGTPVRIWPIEGAPENRTLADRFRSVIGKARGLPADLAENHDHYLHGHPKR